MNYRDRQREIVNQLHYDATGSLNGKASVVPMRADYSHDPALALTTVVFVPPHLAHKIVSTVIEPLRIVEPVHHFYSSSSMHLTIKNVRRINFPPDFTRADINRVHRLYSRLIPQHAAFSVSLEELAPLATSVSLIGYSDERLQTLVQALDAGLAGIGLPDNKQYVSSDVFFGNVTVCRFVQPPSSKFLDAVNRLAYAFRGDLRVKDVSLISCNAVCAPESRTLWHTYSLGD